MIVDRVCYATREEVRRSLDVKNAAYNGEQIDRQILSISDDIDKMCARVFFPQDATRYFDWPNFQYAFPWRLWLNRHESAITPLTQFMSGGILVPTTDYILRPENSGPPYTYIEMRRDRNSVFSSTTTPQQAVVITTTFGYWNKLLSAGTLATTVNNSITTVQVSNGSAVGVGDMISVEGERMIVQDKMAITTGVPLTGGLATASNQDNTFNVPDIALFAVGEVLLVDSERLLIVDMLPNTLVVKRGWDGTLLAAHTSATIYALRGLTVSRGELGTAAAAHTSPVAISVLAIPGAVKKYAVAAAGLGLIQEPGGYAIQGGVMQGQQKEPAPGAGIASLRSDMLTSYSRQIRKWAI